MIIVNFKAYENAVGKNARNLGEICQKVHKETGKEIVAVPQTEDLLRLKHLEVEVFCQHIDPDEPGSHTGSVLPEGVKRAGATGTIINHSEKRLNDKNVKKNIIKARNNNLTTVVCAQTPEEFSKYSEFNPDYIAFEPPELIGGDTSVSEAKPGLIEKAVDKAGTISTLTGAGIKTREDVAKSKELGCEGVLVASGVVKAEDRKEELELLAEGL